MLKYPEIPIFHFVVVLYSDIVILREQFPPKSPVSWKFYI